MCPPARCFCIWPLEVPAVDSGALRRHAHRGWCQVRPHRRHVCRAGGAVPSPRRDGRADGVPLSPRRVPRAANCRNSGLAGTQFSCFRFRLALRPDLPSSMYLLSTAIAPWVDSSSAHPLEEAEDALQKTCTEFVAWGPWKVRSDIAAQASELLKGAP